LLIAAVPVLKLGIPRRFLDYSGEVLVWTIALKMVCVRAVGCMRTRPCGPRATEVLQDLLLFLLVEYGLRKRCWRE